MRSTYLMHMVHYVGYGLLVNLELHKYKLLEYFEVKQSITT